MSNKTAFIVNGTAKNKDKAVSEIKGTFDSSEYEVFISQRKNHIAEIAKSCVDSGFKNIVICGGDGSLNEGLNGIMQAVAFDKVNLGVYPLGTGNDFLKSVGSPKSFSLLKSKIEKGETMKIDIGLASFTGENQAPEQRYFINITDLGIGGVAVKKLQNKISFLSPEFNYNWAIASTMVTYNKVQVACESPDIQWKGKMMSMVIANGKFFGSGLGIAPEARLNDGLFEVVILGDINIFDYIKNLGKVRDSQKINHPEVSYHKTDYIKIRSTDGNSLPIDMDGEFVGFAPIEFQCIPQKINFIV